MVHRLVVSYGKPEDTDAFDGYYRDTHVPLATKIPGLRKFTVGHPQPMDPSQDAPYMVAELDFDSEEAMGQGFASNEGQAAGADVANFATGGAWMTHYEVQEVTLDTPVVP
jgi:uncharacterized protein (TIGR02118 family)